MYFTNNAQGQQELAITRDMYGKHRRLILMAREETSYGIMKREFASNQVFLVPDIVLYLDKSSPKTNRQGILLCLRTDKESVLSEKQKRGILRRLHNYRRDITMKDTVVPYQVYAAGREKELNRIWDQFRSAELVITDRLHGMIFAVITGTPCIVLNNYNHKVKSEYEFVKHLGYIWFAKKADDIFTLLPGCLEFSNAHFRNSHLKPHYEQILDYIG